MKYIKEAVGGPWEKFYHNDSGIIIDRETLKGFRVVSILSSALTFSEAMNILKQQPWFDVVVQIVDPKTGKTVKGPKYDTTEQEVKGNTIENVLKGIKQQPPHEPMQVEPRDRFQENKNMKITREKFQSLIKECLLELKEKSPRERLKESLRPMVDKILKEIANVKTPEPDKEEKEKVRKGYNKQFIHQKDGSKERLDITNDEKDEELDKIVKDIDKSWNVYWDDRGDLVVDAKNLLRVRITPKFENNFDIDAMVKLVDRVRAIALTWEQVKEFVKANFKDLKNKTNTDHLKEKSLANKVDQDKNIKAAGPKNDIIKNRLEDPDNTKLKTTHKKDMDYKKDDVEKEEDQPDQPMKDVGEIKNKNKNIDKTSKVKAPKHEDNKTLRLSDKKTPRLRSRK